MPFFYAKYPKHLLLVLALSYGLNDKGAIRWSVTKTKKKPIEERVYYTIENNEWSSSTC